MNTPHLETIVDGLDMIALILRAGFEEPGVHFLTPPDFSQQLAVMLHPAGKKIAAHVHNPVSRQVIRTQEVLVIRKGRVKVKLFNSRREPIRERVLVSGDIILLCGGGHAFEMLEETALVEVKQGPYSGEADKTEFSEQAGGAG